MNKKILLVRMWDRTLIINCGAGGSLGESNCSTTQYQHMWKNMLKEETCFMESEKGK